MTDKNLQELNARESLIAQINQAVTLMAAFEMEAEKSPEWRAYLKKVEEATRAVSELIETMPKVNQPSFFKVL